MNDTGTLLCVNNINALYAWSCVGTCIMFALASILNLQNTPLCTAFWVLFN